jgi:hypothetical protein
MTPCESDCNHKPGFISIQIILLKKSKINKYQNILYLINAEIAGSNFQVFL